MGGSRPETRIPVVLLPDISQTASLLFAGELHHHRPRQERGSLFNFVTLSGTFPFPMSTAYAMQHLSILRRREYPEVRETGANIPLAPGRGMLHDLAEVLAFPPHLTHDLILFRKKPKPPTPDPWQIS